MSQNLPQICTASALVYHKYIPKQMQYRFAVKYGTLSRSKDDKDICWLNWEDGRLLVGDERIETLMREGPQASANLNQFKKFVFSVMM